MHTGLTRAGLMSLGLLLIVGLAACTTAEGTNALTDVGTFEREVLSSTARGVGLIDAGPGKADLTQARPPLVLPRDTNQLPAPTVAMADQLPVDSDSVQIDTSNISDADMQRLRNARVVDLRSLSGRPLTADETRMLTARMQAANMAVKGTTKRPLYMPPEEYFTQVGDASMLCKASNGALVSLNDPACPASVRRAIKAAMGQSAPTGVVGPNNMTTNSNGTVGY